ncbi:MAG: hypothetical protein GX075_12620 [Firmicutes bacterium]|nr:hypothetical protein [Bacillota bacterium]
MTKKTVLILVICTIIVILGYFIYLLYIFGKTSEREILRIPSPDNRLEAVLTEISGGATTSFVYNLYIVPAKTKISKKTHELFRADHVDEIKVFWSEVKLLKIQYKEARIFHFKNFWQSKEIENYSYVVELRLEPTQSSFSLSERDRWVK